jgi:aldehyde dehydrogenase
MGKAMNTTLFVQNGPCTAGLGAGGEGYVSFSIATPTGEGVTTPATFCRVRRSSTARAMRVV